MGVEGYRHSEQGILNNTQIFFGKILYQKKNLTEKKSMPFARRSLRRRTTYRRRPFRSRRYAYPQSRGYPQRVPRSVGGLRGDCQVRKMRFALKAGDSHELTSTTGSIATQVMRANDLYDPNYTGAGAQPRTFDQYMAMYRHFAVLGFKITTFWTYGTGSATSNSMICAVTLKDGVVALANKSDIIEHSKSKSIVLSAEADRRKLIHKYSYRMNGPTAITNMSNLWGTSASSPTEGWYFHLNAYAVNTTTETASVTGWIDFTVLLFHPIQPASS